MPAEVRLHVYRVPWRQLNFSGEMVSRYEALMRAPTSPLFANAGAAQWIFNQLPRVMPSLRHSELADESTLYMLIQDSPKA